jgi:hypothetical protein
VRDPDALKLAAPTRNRKALSISHTKGDMRPTKRFKLFTKRTYWLETIRVPNKPLDITEGTHVAGRPLGDIQGRKWRASIHPSCLLSLTTSAYPPTI